jgi:hypothetical protein
VLLEADVEDTLDATALVKTLESALFLLYTKPAR